MDSASPLHPSDTLDLAPLGAVGAPTTALDLDLDTMADIAEEAGRDALNGRGTRPPFAASLARYAISAEGDARHGTAVRLYQACLRGATDPATD